MLRSFEILSETRDMDTVAPPGGTQGTFPLPEIEKIVVEK